MVRVEVTAKAKIMVGESIVEVPVTFSFEMENGSKDEIIHEVYHLLKNAALGWGADYQVKVLD